LKKGEGNQDKKGQWLDQVMQGLEKTNELSGEIPLRCATVAKRKEGEKCSDTNKSNDKKRFSRKKRKTVGGPQNSWRPGWGEKGHNSLRKKISFG